MRFRQACPTTITGEVQGFEFVSRRDELWTRAHALKRRYPRWASGIGTMGHKNAQMFFGVYSKWIDGESNQREKAKMAALYAEHLPTREP
ncbi:hypothetical protein [Achromobacter aegrifaciens]